MLLEIDTEFLISNREKDPKKNILGDLQLRNKRIHL